MRSSGGGAARAHTHTELWWASWGETRKQTPTWMMALKLRFLSRLPQPQCGNILVLNRMNKVWAHEHRRADMSHLFESSDDEDVQVQRSLCPDSQHLLRCLVGKENIDKSPKWSAHRQSRSLHCKNNAALQYGWKSSNVTKVWQTLRIDWENLHATNN